MTAGSLLMTLLSVEAIMIVQLTVSSHPMLQITKPECPCSRKDPMEKFRNLMDSPTPAEGDGKRLRPCWPYVCLNWPSAQCWPYVGPIFAPRLAIPSLCWEVLVGFCPLYVVSGSVDAARGGGSGAVALTANSDIHVPDN